MKTRAETSRMFMASAAVLAAFAGSSLAWQPADEPQTVAKAETPAADAAMPKMTAPVGPAGRRPINGEPTPLGFRNVTVDQIVPFIVESTGKVVMPQQDVLNRKVTILNDRPIPREDSLDLVFQALQQIGVAVVESPTVISLRDIAEITRQDVPVIGPNESTLNRKDLGNFAEKIYRLRSSTAKAMGDTLKGSLPDFAKMTVDEESNQIAVMGNIALLQRLEQKISGLDRPPAAALQTETFNLKFQEATTIKENIEELFGTGGNRSRAGGNNQNQGGGPNRGGPNFQMQGRGGDQPASAAAGEVRVTANTQQNSVTVAADPAILAQIRDQIQGHWDREMPVDVIKPKIYDLKYSDPVKVAAQLEGIFGRGTSNRTGQQQQQPQGGGPFGGFNQNNQAAPVSGQGAGRLMGQFAFTPMPDSGRLMVVAKTPDNIKVLDDLIEQIDQPQNAGLPAIIELKHASAEDLAEQINALLAQDGTGYAIRRAASGLSDSSANSSPFSTTSTTTTADQNGFSQESQTLNSQTMNFWWQRSRPPTDRRASSNLIGQLRIVPIWRQNALMIASPPEYKQAIIDLVQALDKPGRQVLIAAIVAEVSRDDATALGLRWSSEAINPTLPDNSFSIGGSATGQKNEFINSLFDTSVLDVNANLNVILQALAQKTDVSILSEPKIFTSDNQEAEFFDGQDIPFVTDSQTNAQGNLVQSFDYRAVGIQLRARPRITVQGDVDLKVNLELSSIVPGQTLFGGFVVDRRETTTQLIVRNKQTIVISGILRAESSDIVRKVPLLGDIPLLGAIFRSKEKTVTNTELLVFITPIVVVNSGGTDLDELNEPYRDRLEHIKGQLRKEEPLKGRQAPTELEGGPRPAGDSGTTGPRPAADTADPNPRPALEQKTVPEQVEGSMDAPR